MQKLYILFVLAVSAAITASEVVNKTAIVHLKNGDVEGNVTFEQTGTGKVRITGVINGLTDGKHGFHIHEKGDISSCANAGGHYNPLKKQHGAPTSAERHVGDLGNIEVIGNVANFSFEDNVICLTGEHSIIGRAVVVHAKEDDLGNTTHPDSKTTGNAGGRVVCGVIGIKEPVNWPSGSSASTPISALSLGVVSIIAAFLSTF